MALKTFNLYCDESCHLENDHLQVMCLGYTKIAASDYPNYKESIKAIKNTHQSPTELKWNKLSMSRWSLYKALIDFFFEEKITFRTFLVKDKSQLDHAHYNHGSHDEFYYKSVYYLLNTPLNPNSNRYKVFLDIKDTRGKEKLLKIHEVFENKYYGESPFQYFQHIHSFENELIQLTDLFIGAITFKVRGEHLKSGASAVKCKIVEYIELKTGFPIDRGTSRHTPKFNIFEFNPRISTK